MRRFPIPLFLLLILLVFIYVGDMVYKVSPFEIDSSSVLLAPSLNHPFGTDRLGRDLLARVLEGAKTSIAIGFLSALFTSLIGLIIGISAGFFKGVIDRSVVILIDLFLTFPTFFLLLALVSYVDASMIILIVVISITGWMSIARLIRAESFSISKKPFIKILKLAKVSNTKIFFKYFLPLLAPIFLVNFTFGVSGAILAESGLSFLGLGIQPPNISLGTILEDGKDLLDVAWWISFFPGLLIFLLTYLLIQIADFLQTSFNKRDLN